MSRVVTPLPESIGEIFSVRSARADGVSVRRLRHPSLEAPFRGSRARPLEPDTDDDGGPYDGSPYAKEATRLRAEMIRRARALFVVAPNGWFFCHATAAVLWGLPVPLRLLRSALNPARKHGADIPPQGIDVAVHAPGRAPRAAGTHGRQLARSSAGTAVVDGLPVSDPATTWALLAGDLSVDELIEIGDAIVNIPRRRGMTRGSKADALATMEQLAAAVSTPYRRRSGKLQAALAQVRVGSSSVAETRIRLDGERSGLPSPELDYDVFTLDGSPIGFTEIAYPEYHLLVEYEGDHHRTDRDQWQRDVEKHRACVEAGWEVLRLTAKDAFPTTKPAVARIRNALVRAGWRP